MNEPIMEHETIAECTLTAMNGRTIKLRAIRTPNLVLFNGGGYGGHSIAADSTNERIKTHFDGYCQNRANLGLWSMTFYYYF